MSTRAILRAAARAVRPPRALVLAYHRVADLELDPWSLAVAPERFRDQLEALGRRFATVSLADVAAGRGPAGAVAVTFDDGYVDLLDEAKPLLEQVGVPAAAFLVSGALGRRTEFWWDALERAVLLPRALPSQLELELPQGVRTWSLDGEADSGPGGRAPARGWRASDPPETARQALFQSLWLLLKPLRPPERDHLLVRLAKWSGTPIAARPTHRTLTAEEARSLAAGGLVELGGHTVTHPTLASLPADGQRGEIAGCRGELERLTGRAPAGFSYPHGTDRDYTPETTAIVREAGFRYACSSLPGGIHRSTDRFNLPRVVVRDVPGRELADRLAALGLRGRRA